MLFLATTGYAQVGFGVTASTDLYQRYVNPIVFDANNESRAAGNAILNLGIGPKLWFGGEDFSVSLEGQVVWGITTFSLDEYKGMGSASFPFMAKLNFGGLSGLNKEGKMGWSIGGGLAWTKTEAYGLSDDARADLHVRDYFPTFMTQIGYGFGISGFSTHGFVRYGFDSDNEASTLNIGLQFDFNVPMLNKIADPASAL